MSFFDKLNNKFSKFYDKVTTIETIRNIFFYLGITLFFIGDSSDYSIIGFTPLVKNLLLYSGFTLLVLKIFLTQESLYNYIKYFIYILIAIILDNVIGTKVIALSIVLYIMSSKKVDINKFFKYLFFINCIILIFNLYVYIANQFLGFNLFGTRISPEYYLYRNNLIRHGFYFYHPNAFSFYLFWTYMLYIYLQWDSFKRAKQYIKVFIASVLLAIVCFFCTQTRIATIFFLITVPLLFVFKNKKFQNSRLIKWILSYFYVILFIISMLLLVSYGLNNVLGVISLKISDILNGRIWLGNLELTKYGLTLFGQPGLASKFFVVDNGYYHILIKYGLLATLFFLSLFVKTSKRLCINKDYKCLYLITLFCVYNFIEALLVHPQSCIIYAILGMFI